MTAQENFRENLRVALKARGLSQMEVARRMGTSGPYVNNVLHGKLSPSLEQCERLARCAGFSLIALLCDAGEFAAAVKGVVSADECRTVGRSFTAKRS